MGILDPDKIVEKVKADREALYQSSEQPEHFSNEGEEFANIETGNNNDVKGKADYEKIVGIKDNPHKDFKDKFSEPEEKKSVRD